MAAQSRPQRPWVFALVLIGVTAGLYRHVLLHVTSAVPSDLGDPLLNIWILWWNAHHLPFTAAYWNAPIFAPAPYAFALSETLLGLTWLTTPLQWLGASPLVAYNVLFLITPVLNGLAAWWLCFTLTRRSDAAAIGGLAYAFAPYHAAQFPHIQTQAMFWMPVALVGLHTYWETGKRRWLVCLSAATAMNALTCGYFLLYFSVLLAMAVAWLAMGSGTLRRVGAVVAAIAVAALPVVPVMLTYRFVKSMWQLGRPLVEIESFSADAMALFIGADRLTFWPIHGQPWQETSGIYPEYPGLAVMALLLVALGMYLREPSSPLASSPWRRRVIAGLVSLAALSCIAASAYGIAGNWAIDAGPIHLSVSNPYKPIGLALDLLIVAALMTAGFGRLVKSGSMPGLYAMGAVASTVLALGPVGRIFGERFWYKPPFAVLLPLPGFDELRVPALFSAITVLCLAVLSAYAVARIAPRRIAVAVIAAAIVLDGWATLPAVAAPMAIGAPPADLVVELPRPDGLYDDSAAMYRAMGHGRPIVNGYSGYTPPHYASLIRDLRDSCVASLDAVRSGRSLHVVIWRAKDGAAVLDAAMREYWGSGVREESTEAVFYRIPRGPSRAPGTGDPRILDMCSHAGASRGAGGLPPS